MSSAHQIEIRRLSVQRELDSARSRQQRNRLGQFATPPALADEILQFAQAQLGNCPVRFLDPAIGTGSFYSALSRLLPASRLERATGFELDPYYGHPCRTLWRGTALRLRLQDFSAARAPGREATRYNLVVCNPPYVRHHHLTAQTKQRLQRRVVAVADLRLSGLSGLYAYFLALAHPWMRVQALASWLIPAEFMDVNYGVAIKRYLLERVTLLRIHRFDPADVQFDDACVSSAIVWFRNAPPAAAHKVEFSAGGSLSAPTLRQSIGIDALRDLRKWNHLADTGHAVGRSRRSSGGAVLGDFFHAQRGIATGANKFFLMTDEQIDRHNIPRACVRPVLPGPRQLAVDEVMADETRAPVLAHRLWLLDCQLSERQIRLQHPQFWQYLKSGRLKIARGYLCSRRVPWYSQESRSPTYFLCSYIARDRNGRCHRFIFNRSDAIATNNYLMLYPRAQLTQFIDADVGRARLVWQALCEIETQSMRSGGRVYGGGMRKIEPREIESIQVPSIAALVHKY